MTTIVKEKKDKIPMSKGITINPHPQSKGKNPTEQEDESNISRIENGSN